MATITHIIQDPLGMHARPAGMLVKEASKYPQCTIHVSVEGGTPVDAKRIMGVMKLAAKQGMTLTVTVTGENEDTLALQLQDFLKENL